MKIGIDLDGVVLNTEALWAVYAEIYDVKELKRNSVVKNGEPRIQEIYQWTEEEQKTFFNRYLDITDFDLVPGAKEVLKQLKEDGHELIVVTARGSVISSSKGIEIAQNKFKKSGLEFDEYLWSQTEKEKTALKENIDVMIDDNYHICEKINKHNIKTIYFHSLNRKHLKETDTLKEVTNWGEVYRQIHDWNCLDC